MICEAETCNEHRWHYDKIRHCHVYEKLVRPCQKNAKFLYKGKHLCADHAKVEIMKRALEKKELVPISQEH